jgi:hypothetical protein
VEVFTAPVTKKRLTKLAEKKKEEEEIQAKEL